MVDPILIGLINYASSVMSFIFFITLLIFIPLLICKLYKRSHLTFIHSAKSKLKRIPYFSRLRDLKFTPSIFVPSGNMQTWSLPFFSFQANSRKHLWTFNYKREILTLSDKGQISLDWVEPKNPIIASKVQEHSTPIIIVVPGLTGHNDDLYMVSTALESVSHEYQMVIANHRGWSNSKLTTPRFYCAGTTKDLEQAVNYIASKYSTRDIYLLGFSVGANILTNYLGTHGANVPARAAMWVGNPFDLIKVSERIGTKLFGLYNHIFTKNLVRKYNQHIDTLRPLEKTLNRSLEDALNNLKTVRELDELITIKQYGFKSVDEYYAATSSVNQLSNVRIPTLYLNALDDPIFDKSAIPFEKFHENDYIMLATTKGGGHIGFLHGIMSVEQWFTIPIFEFLNYYRNH